MSPPRALALGGNDGTGGAATSPSGGAPSTSTGGTDAVGTGGGAAGADPGGGTGGEFTGTCTPSVSAGRNVSGSGPHDVVVETNDDPGINEGTIYRPADLGAGKNYPIVVWGNGACSRDGLSNEAAMAEIASHGYFVVADGTPGSNAPGRPLGGGGDVLLGYVDWVIEENGKPCSEYYQSIDTTKVAATDFRAEGSWRRAPPRIRA